MKEELKGKKILLGVTGSISAYKSALLVRELIKVGAEVRVVMTPSAKEFITPLTLSNLSRNPVIVDMFDKQYQTEGAWHIKLVHWCDLMIIAPCSAATIGKIANGICDTALTTLAIALPKDIPLLIAPAMDSTMLEHFSTKKNLDNLSENGIIIIPPEEGELSSGLIGPGRLPETNVLMEYIASAIDKSIKTKVSEIFKSTDIEFTETDKPFEQKFEEILENTTSKLEDVILKDNISVEYELKELKLAEKRKEFESFYQGKKVMITAGPTYEKIDDVRFISNYSSGKMGYALARQAKLAGAEVVLISGPVEIAAPDGVKLIKVETADEMFDSAVEEFKDTDIAILAAAVADYTPINPVKGKIKKSETGERLILELQLTNDILATLADVKQENQILVGFALESINEVENGWKKLKEKNCDIMIVNSLNQPQSGFRSDYNTITILTRKGTEDYYPPMSKEDCAIEILNKISNFAG